MLNACGARSGAGGGAQEDAKAFLCALEMVAAALHCMIGLAVYKSEWTFKGTKYDYWTHALVSWNFTPSQELHPRQNLHVHPSLHRPA
jgi:hypothetical protein